MNPALVRYWQWTEVQHCPDLDKHDLLWSDFTFPATIEKVPKWTLPRCFETVLIDRQVLKQVTEDSAVQLDADIRQHLTNDDVDQALSHWSAVVEAGFAQACCDVEGQPVTLGRKYFGRCAQREVKWVHLAQPRPKSGRPGDFCPKYLTSDLCSLDVWCGKLGACNVWFVFWRKASHIFMWTPLGYGIASCRLLALRPLSLIG